MTGNSSSNQSIAVPPGGQACFAMPYMPQSVLVQNNDMSTDTQFVLWWLYPDATTPVFSQYAVASGSAVSVYPPPPDGSGVNVATAVIFNTGAASLTCSLR